MLSSMYYAGLKERIKDTLILKDLSTKLKVMINRSIKIDDRQYQRYQERKGITFYALAKQKSYEELMKIDAIKSRDDKKCYICEKKGHLKKNCAEKNREEICALNEIN